MTDNIPTRESLAGYFVTEPRLGTTSTGERRLVARVGVEHWLKEPDGSRRPLEPSYHTLAIYGILAEGLEGRFRRGDRFVAAGYTRSFPIDRAGVTDVRYEFVAHRIGHDSARTRYVVDRGPAADHPAGRHLHGDAPSRSAESPPPGPRLRLVPSPASSARRGTSTGADLTLGR